MPPIVSRRYRKVSSSLVRYRSHTSCQSAEAMRGTTHIDDSSQKPSHTDSNELALIRVDKVGSQDSEDLGDG